MRIAQIAPLAESVPPKLYGGTERVIAWLTDELVALGHEVSLFASGDSKTSARLVPVWPRALRLGRPRTDPAIANAALIEAVGRSAGDFDVIHCHADWTHLPMLSRLGVPHVMTQHGRLDLPGLSEMVRLFPDTPHISISDNQRSALPEGRFLGTVYHGLPPDSLAPSFAPGEYLAFLGRLAPEKGADAAIRIARAAGLPIRLSAKIPRGNTGYFKDTLEPMIDGDKAQLVGEVDDHTKQAFLAGAKAVLFPIDWPEPFGLVMIEAMACGAPVIAFRCGSVPEVVEDGVTGFIVEDEDEAVRAVSRVPELDRRRVREGFERRFTSRRMAEEYVRHYQALAGAPR